MHTSPSGTTTIVGHIRIVNNHNAALTFTLSHGGLAATNNAFNILPPLSIEAGGWAEFDGTIIMETGDTLVGISGTDEAINLTVYGLELT